ncbi:hypothetical protein [Nodularia chucula]|uniref:hypothetical protein n=1 Tax=Nodularia chucula TaxID=3093667 RepID=UPI0039C72920
MELTLAINKSPTAAGDENTHSGYERFFVILIAEILLLIYSSINQPSPSILALIF